MIAIIVLVFLLGFLSSELYSAVAQSISLSNSRTEESASSSSVSARIPDEKPSPQDRITESMIKVYNDRVVIFLTDPQWAGFSNTNSMDPVLDDGTNAIEVMPKSSDDINVGDIISYQIPSSNDVIIHRVVEIAEDSDGWYAIAKGDNLSKDDPYKVRFSWVKRVVVALIY